ncbi:TetR/AcrR family transcriptional regulator [Nocardia sp. NBC_00416]|uniref:TetR/AcrR family transcriptional regulator n=1 Tax=Nocardia sp. NBC_00416 TaxID=2975991 RepID=UPI002E22D6BC
MRSHAERNYRRILAAATAAFAESGPDASLNEIAKRAGVGPGTLYRHFANRQTLQLAVLRERVEALCERGEELLSEPDADTALEQWLRALLQHTHADKGLGAAALTGPLGHDFECRAAIGRTATQLLTRAQTQGTARGDTSADDLIQLVAGIGLAAADSADSDRSGRLLRIVVDGLFAR